MLTQNQDCSKRNNLTRIGWVCASKNGFITHQAISGFLSSGSVYGTLQHEFHIIYGIDTPSRRWNRRYTYAGFEMILISSFIAAGISAEPCGIIMDITFTPSQFITASRESVRSGYD